MSAVIAMRASSTLVELFDRLLLQTRLKCFITHGNSDLQTLNHSPLLVLSNISQAIPGVGTYLHTPGYHGRLRHPTPSHHRGPEHPTPSHHHLVTSHWHVGQSHWHLGNQPPGGGWATKVGATLATLLRHVHWLLPFDHILLSRSPNEHYCDYCWWGQS